MMTEQAKAVLLKDAIGRRFTYQPSGPTGITFSGSLLSVEAGRVAMVAYDPRFGEETPHKTICPFILDIKITPEES